MGRRRCFLAGGSGSGVLWVVNADEREAIGAAESFVDETAGLSLVRSRMTVADTEVTGGTGLGSTLARGGNTAGAEEVDAAGLAGVTFLAEPAVVAGLREGPPGDTLEPVEGDPEVAGRVSREGSMTAGSSSSSVDA